MNKQNPFGDFVYLKIPEPEQIKSIPDQSDIQIYKLRNRPDCPPESPADGGVIKEQKKNSQNEDTSNFSQPDHNVPWQERFDNPKTIQAGNRQKV